MEPSSTSEETNNSLSNSHVNLNTPREYVWIPSSFIQLISFHPQFLWTILDGAYRTG